MKKVLLTDGGAKSAPTACALGMFDGVHMGHRRIITAAKNKSTELGISTSVLIFSSSPHGAAEILPLCERLKQFKALGVDTAFIYDFEELRDMSPELFVSKILKDELCAAAVTAGFNYRFGKGGSGDSQRLIALAKENNIDAHICDKVVAGGEAVSSTRIRKLLADGDIEGANELLTYPYYITAKVLHGKELGRRLGLPTINQKIPSSRAKMAHGIYYTKTYIDSAEYISVSNLGIRPTVDDGDKTNLETHILDFDGDLYGKEITVAFFGKGRDEKKFGDTESLRREVELDCERARAFFADKKE